MDEYFMSLAIKEALKGLGYTSPNPMVGAIITRNNEILSCGYHRRYKTLHAERNAILNCLDNLKGATLYVNLEPCCHSGNTPPCTDIIIQSGISRVVVGCLDPNPLVKGRGIKILNSHGIETTVGVLNEESLNLNKVFFNYIKNKKPYVIMKYAMTLDGKIATSTGDSKWISGNSSRENVHRSRHINMAIMVGVGTILNDNPLLTCRDFNGKNPIRIICDTNLSTPLTSNVVNTAETIKTIIATSCNESNRLSQYKNAGIHIINVPKKENHIDLNILMDKLYQLKIDSVFLEGGSTLNFTALSSGIVNKIESYISPKLIGGVNAKSPIGGDGIKLIKNAVNTKLISTQIFDNDILLEWEVIN
ncbi:MAG: bifunctional diaminohydroxyphosphoribosylaminopyrimidine deaminase/5-amino-6-(5-phosphoribosylamino)uracil reductase RibD [Clostridium sp.]